MTQADISAEWYRRRADRYAQIAADPDWYTFVTHSHPNLTDELAVFDRLLELLRGPHGLDLGSRPYHDPGYDADRSFCLYDADEVVDGLRQLSKGKADESRRGYKEAAGHL